MTAKKFIAISTGIHNNKLVYIATSAGKNLYDQNGIEFITAIDFLYRLKKPRTVLVVYGFSRDNEFIFSSMSDDLKHKLFQSHYVREVQEQLEFELESFEDDFLHAPKESQEFQYADFARHVNLIKLKDLKDIQVGEFKFDLINGKRLVIRKNKRIASIYDIYGFFKPASLRKVIKEWLGQDVALLDNDVFLKADFTSKGIDDLDRLKIRADIEVSLIEKLAVKLNTELTSIGINLSRYHGATAISSHILGKSHARNYYYNYKYKRQLSSELNRACYQSMYGGRAEQFKIGTLKNVNVYDLNSAYANAITYLPILLSKPVYETEYKPETPFALWHCNYDLSDNDNYLGVLPNRNSGNFTKYGVTGKGYFWTPEINYIVENFPDCIEIDKGFTFVGEIVPFANDIRLYYLMRQLLQSANNPLEKVVKLSLAALYGKFAQHKGSSAFYNPFYAGFITSFTRAELLRAVRGVEAATISFQTDAIHTTAKLPVSLSNELGEWKHTNYSKVIYLDCGVYRAYKGRKPVKEKTRGFRHFDFDKAIDDLKTKRSYNALAEFFVGHNLAVKNLFGRENYLKDMKQDRMMQPVSLDQSVMRRFEMKDVDLLTGFLDSAVIGKWNGLESAVYRSNYYSDADAGLETISAGRV